MTKRHSKESRTTRTTKVIGSVRCGDLNHLIGEFLKPLRDKNQKAFVSGSWSDSGEEDDERAKDKTCLMTKASSEVASDDLRGALFVLYLSSAHLSDNLGLAHYHELLITKFRQLNFSVLRFSFSSTHSSSSGLMNGEGIGTKGPSRTIPLRVVMGFNSPFGLAMVLLGRCPEPEVEAFWKSVATGGETQIIWMNTTTSNTNFLNGFYESWRWGCLELFENSCHSDSYRTHLLIDCISKFGYLGGRIRIGITGFYLRNNRFVSGIADLRFVFDNSQHILSTSFQKIATRSRIQRILVGRV
nr:alpha/beta hydrolases superfamily protein [Tanacetum cinerariifolium]